MAKRKLEVVIVGDSSSLKRAVGGANAHLATLNKGLGGTVKSALKFGAASVGITGVGAAIAGVVKTGMSFEKQMSTLGAVTGANAKQMADFKKQAIDAGIKTKFSALEAAQAQTELAKGGLSVKQIMGGGLKAALSLAAAGDMELAEAAATASNAMNLFHLEGGRANAVADQMATAANATTADVSDFAMALTQGGSAAKQAGLSFTDTMLVLEGLAKSGVKNSDAGTSMKTAILQLLAPTKKQAELQEALNLSFVGANGKMKPVVQIAGMLRDRLGKMSDAQRVATLKTLAGTDGFRTLAGLFDLGARNAAKLRQGLQEHGTAADVAAKKNDNLAGRWEAFKGTMETMAIVLFDKIKPALESALASVSKFATEMLKGEGAGGRFVTRLKEAWDSLQPLVAGLRSAGIYLANHPKLVLAAAGAFIAFKVAVVGARTALSAYHAAVAVGTGALKAYRAAMVGLTAIRFGWAGLKSQAATGGVSVGQSFASKMGLTAAAGIAGWQIGSWLRKHVPAVKSAGDAIGKSLANMFTGADEAQKFDRQMARITGNVDKLAKTFKTATDPAERLRAKFGLQTAAAKANAAQASKTIATLLAQGASMDGTGKKSDALRAAVKRLHQAEQDAANAARNLKAGLDAIPRNIEIALRFKGMPRGAGSGGKGSKVFSASTGGMGRLTAGDFLFPDEVDLASVQAQRDSTQAGFDATDLASRRAAAKRGTRSKDKSTRNQARNDLRELNREIERTKQLSKIDIKIKGREDAIRFRDALKGVKSDLKDIVKQAGEAFRTRREKEIDDTLNADLTAIDESADAKELADLQQKDREESDRRERASLDKALADAIAEGDKEAQAQAQDDIAAYERQKREEVLAANITRAQKEAEDKATAAKGGLDKEVADFEANLTNKLNVEATKLEERKTSYKKFLEDVSALAGQFGVDPAVVLGMGNPDTEAAINNPWVAAWLKKNPGKSLPGRATGGPVSAGAAYIVGERGPEVLQMGSRSGRIIPNAGGWGGDINLAPGGVVKIGSQVDLRREMNRVAFRLA